ncbi:uncharacterized protein A4U43_C01F28320 [Asparagus officinalis]|uniref:Arp2/3 complex 34 kDa subunit n=1 Tax=Asparagus officinalis TaxID=4686 RepID=A0A5P1FWM8_ASPOF|nr:uncharacterized protein A4U43_C01F28320 [Asparagus officinalis]
MKRFFVFSFVLLDELVSITFNVFENFVRVDKRNIALIKIASVRDVVLGAPLRLILKQLALRTLPPDEGQLIALVHRPMESFFLIPQEFVEARRTPGLNSAPLCTWSPTPPLELKEAPAEALEANAGFVTFVIFPRHVEGRKLDRTAWSLSTFHAYVSYHVKCSEGFMHTRMRRRVESLIEALDRAKPDMETKKVLRGNSFKRLSIKDARGNSKS